MSSLLNSDTVEYYEPQQPIPPYQVQYTVFNIIEI